MVKADVDEVLAAAASFQTFVLGLQQRGYIVKYGPEIHCNLSAIPKKSAQNQAP